MITQEQIEALALYRSLLRAKAETEKDVQRQQKLLEKLMPDIHIRPNCNHDHAEEV